MALPGQVARAVQPELGDVRALAVTLVAALRLAEVVSGPGDVEDVVDDLEQDAQLGRKAAIGHCGSFRRTFQEQYARHGGADQAAGLQRMQGSQLVRGGSN